MSYAKNLTDEQLTRALAYAGFILVAYELLKSMIVKPIKEFYTGVNFGDGMPFKTYQEDVLGRHKHEFEACLLYLRDFMKAIDSDDLLAIRELRNHRNELAHNLVAKLHDLDIENHAVLLEKADKVLFKLSKYRTFMEIGSDPAFQNKGIDWESVKGHEYLVFEEVLRKTKALSCSR